MRLHSLSIPIPMPTSTSVNHGLQTRCLQANGQGIPESNGFRGEGAQLECLRQSGRLSSFESGVFKAVRKCTRYVCEV